MQLLYFLIIIFLLASCTNDKHLTPSQNEKINSKYLSEFIIPAISQRYEKDSVNTLNEKNLTGSYLLTSTVAAPVARLNLPADGRDTSLWNYIIRNVWDLSFENISYDGLEVLPDYATTVYSSLYSVNRLYTFYPLYIVNRTSVDRFVPGKDSHLFGIQEAMDSTGNWRPLEGRGLDFCGNGYWYIKLAPNNFLMILVPKYEGTYKTRIRVRIEIGNMVYVTNSFPATINYNQFFIKPGSYFAQKIKEDKHSAIQDIFYGSVPLGIEKKQVISHAVYAQQPQ